jgi:hypothetical protein
VGWNGPGRAGRGGAAQGWDTRGAGEARGGRDADRRRLRDGPPVPGSERGATEAGRGYPGGGARGSGGGGNRRGPGPADSPAEPAGLRRAPGLRWLGTLSTRVATGILFVAALIGVLGTLLTGSEPGKLLSYLVIIGSVIAALGIRRRSLYLLIPLPALTFFICAVLTGVVKDRHIDTSKTEFGLTFLQWIAGVFFAMCTATILVLLIGAGRWLLSRQLVAGEFGMSARAARADGNAPRPAQAPGQRTDRDRRPLAERDPWVAPWERDDPGGQRANRPGDARDPWGDRRQPPGSQPATRAQPGAQPPTRAQPGSQPATRAQPGAQPPTRAQPGSQPPGRGQPGGQDQDPWGQRDRWNRRGPQGTGNQPDGRDRPDPRDPWGGR